MLFLIVIVLSKKKKIMQSSLFARSCVELYCGRESLTFELINELGQQSIECEDCRFVVIVNALNAGIFVFESCFAPNHFVTNESFANECKYYDKMKIILNGRR